MQREKASTSAEWALRFRAMRASRVNPVVPALLGASCISCSAIFVRLADMGAGTTAFYRCALALPLLIVLAVFEQRRRGTRSSANRAQSAFAGMFLGVDLFLWTHAIYDVGAGIATVLGNLQIVFVTFIAWVLWSERPRLQFLIALPVVVVGIVLVTGLAAKAGPGDHPMAGVFYGLGSSITYAAFLLIFRTSIKKSRHVAGPLADATAGAAFAAAVLGLALGELRFSPPLHAFFWLLVLALTSQTLGWLLITTSLPRLPAAMSSLLLLFQPTASLVLAAVVLAERPTPLQVLGAVLLCSGVLLAARTNNRAGELTLPDPSPS